MPVGLITLDHPHRRVAASWTREATPPPFGQRVESCFERSW